MEGNECKDDKRLKMSTKKYMPQRGRCLRKATLSGPVAMDEVRFVAFAKNLVEEKKEE